MLLDERNWFLRCLGESSRLHRFVWDCTNPSYFITRVASELAIFEKCVSLNVVSGIHTFPLDIQKEFYLTLMLSSSAARLYTFSLLDVFWCMWTQEASVLVLLHMAVYIWRLWS